MAQKRWFFLALRGNGALVGVTEGDELPRAVWGRSFAPQNIEIPIIGLDFEEEVFGTVPLIDYFFHEVLVFAHTKTDRPFTLLVTGIAVDLELHGDIVRRMRVMIPGGILE